MNYIYKITNLVNGKVYIGLTTTSIKNRWRGHLQDMKRGTRRHLYMSMRKYGEQNFTIEEIDRTDDLEELGRLERRYIADYNSTDPKVGYNITRGGERCQLDGNPRARLTVDDVEAIRRIYAECKVGPTECWQIYKDRISFDAFEKIWQGLTWKSVCPDVYSNESIEAHRGLRQRLSVGEKNANALYSDEEVLEIRKFYVNHSLSECYETFGGRSGSKVSFRRVLDGTYPNVPVYKKNEQRWIDSSKPVERVRRVKDGNEIRIMEDHVEIDAYHSSGEVSGTYLTDLENLELLKAHKWRTVIKPNGTKALCCREGYFKRMVTGSSVPTKCKDGNCFNLMMANIVAVSDGKN